MPCTIFRTTGLSIASIAWIMASSACHTRSAADTSGGSNGGSVSVAAVIAPGPAAAPFALSANIVVDQFGYRLADEKIAVVRNPRTGFDAGKTFTPGPTYALVDARSGQKVFEGPPVAWSGGTTDRSSGDQAWHFDFSGVKTPGEYFVADETQRVRSDVFTLADTVYRDVLKQAVRMLFYQRDGFAKAAPYAGAEWADDAAHMERCFLYNDPSKTPDRDLHGGWWDAGDFNKYTNWGAEDVIELLRAYREKPAAFFDDYGIPESGNGVPDALDEAKWEIDWLVRMQTPEGSVLSIVGQPSAQRSMFGTNTRPSKGTAPCKYGPATTAASFNTAAAFAEASIVFSQVAGEKKTAAAAGLAAFAADLASRSARAYAWAAAHEGGGAVFFYNAQNGVGAGEQEVGANGLPLAKLAAALYLFEATGDGRYRADFDANYAKTTLFQQHYADAFHTAENEILLAYMGLAGATPAVVQQIRVAFASASQSAENLGSVKAVPDPYGAYLKAYVWGSNQVKADQGNLLYDVVAYGVDPNASDARTGAERYVHYVHGVNPLGLVYLSNMGGHGAVRSVTRIFHSWFAKGSPWEAVGVSKYGPPPGYLTGGPNPAYRWDGCCPSSCNGQSCGAAPLSPPAGQPDQKSYLDFNDDWPLDSWEVAEPDDGYQIKYIRLLSKFVD